MYTPFKMKGKSPMMKALIGKQGNLPAELQAKIKASPATMKKESAMKMKKESSMKMMKKSPAKANQYGPKSKVTFAEAYKKRDMKTYGNLNQAEYTKEAKRQTANKKATTKAPRVKKVSELSKDIKGNKGTGKGSGGYTTKGKEGSFDAPKSQMKGSVTGPKTKGGTKDSKLPSTKRNIVITKNKTKTDANDARVAKLNKTKSDKIKAGNKTAKTRKRTKVGKLATRIANKFRKNKVDPNRVDVKDSAAKMKKKSSMKMMKKK